MGRGFRAKGNKEGKHGTTVIAIYIYMYINIKYINIYKAAFRFLKKQPLGWSLMVEAAF